METLLVLVTVPSAEVADALADAVVSRSLAACVTVLPGARSMYRWQGKIEKAEEHVCLIKTTAARYAELERAIVALHPYDVPEVIALPMSAGLPAYLAWVTDSVGATRQ